MEESFHSLKHEFYELMGLISIQEIMVNPALIKGFERMSTLLQNTCERS